jgi:hypothetical protein
MAALMRKTFLCAASFVIFTVLPAAWTNAAEKSSLSEGAVTVFFDEQLRGVAEGILGIYPSLQEELEEKLGMDTGFPHEIVLVKDAGEFRDMAGSGLIVAVAFSGRDLVVVDYTRVVEEPFTLEDTLKHELCHLAIHHFVYRQGADRVEAGRAPWLPRWLNEGVCQWASGSLGELAALGSTTYITTAALMDRLIPLRRLEKGFPPDGKALLLAYEQSRSVVEHMAGRYGRRGLQMVLVALQRGYEIDGALLMGLGRSYDEMERAWVSELKREHTWLRWLSGNIYAVLFALGGLLLLYGFLRVLWRMKNYRDEDEEEL